MTPFMNQHNPQYVVARDSLHDPCSWMGFLRLIADNNTSMNTGYIITHQPLAEAKSLKNESEMTVRIEPSKLKNWPLVNCTIES